MSDQPEVPPITLRTVTQSARRDVLGQQLEMAEREHVANEYRLNSAVNDKERAQFETMLADSAQRVENLQGEVDDLEAEIAATPAPEPPVDDPTETHSDVSIAAPDTTSDEAVAAAEEQAAEGE